MDHLPVPDSCRQRMKPVPYLGISPRYDRNGFFGFPERHGISPDRLINLRARSTLQAPVDGMDESLPSTFLESFLQEWLWFGALHEFELACGVNMNPGMFVRFGSTRVTRVLNTEPLLTYVRQVAIERLLKETVPLDLRPGEYVYIRQPQTTFAPALEDGPYCVCEVLEDKRCKIQDMAGTISIAFVKRLAENTNTTTNYALGPYQHIPLKILTQLLALLRPNKARNRAEESQNRVAKCLREVRRLTRLVLSEERPVLRLEIALSIDILCSGLSEALSTLLDEHAKILIPSTFYLERLGDQMVAENWCPARAESETALTIDIHYILSLLPSHSLVSHQNCGTTICSYRPQTLGVLRADHKVGGCDCESMHFDEAELINILRNGGNPGISEIQDRNTEIGYQIVDTTGKPYVAISHVWSHGLGNPSKNTLPSCQIRRLFSLIKQIGPSDVMLWIDTLSVPIQLKYKELAMTKLRDVYRNADKVLVLDRNLQQVGSHWLEQRLQLMCSEWMRRLWTLQEGRLASDLYIQFANRATPLSELIQSKPPNDSCGFDSDIFSGAYLHTGLRTGHHFLPRQDFQDRLLDLAMDLGRRSVTVPSDEPICVATMLGMELETLEAFPATMYDIYRHFQEIPPDLLFVQSGRLDIPGFRWAPSTLLETGLNTFTDRPPTGVLTENGLQFRRDCLYFEHGFDFRRDPESLPEMYLVRSGEFYEFAFKASDTRTLIRPLNLAIAAIILQRDGDAFGSFSKGILVSVFGEVDGLCYCHFEGHVYVWRMSRSTFRDIDTMLNQPLRKANYAVTGRFDAQRWFCVD